MPNGAALNCDSLTDSDYLRIARFAQEQLGLDLTEDKKMLVAARLSKIMKPLGMESFSDYYDHVSNDLTGHALACMADELTTNHTSFFRESEHLDFLCETVLPQLKTDEINLWSAGCSTGEEPYSIAIFLAETLRSSAERLRDPTASLCNRAAPRVRILASDVSSRALLKASRAIYEEDRFRMHSPARLSRYLLRATSEQRTSYRIKDEIRSMISFRQINLVRSFSSLPRFHVIFCRNVMIYFDSRTQQNLIERLLPHLEPGGYLMIGHAESLSGIDHPLEYVFPAIYRRRTEANLAPTRNASRPRN